MKNCKSNHVDVVHHLCAHAPKAFPESLQWQYVPNKMKIGTCKKL